MKKYVILSVNENYDYGYFTPLTCWCWHKVGYKPIILYRGTKSEIAQVFLSCNIFHGLNPIDGIRDATIAQVSRLYGSTLPGIKDDDYVLLGDIDMLPLGNHWNADTSKVTVWNHDLTGFGEVPMCYVGAPAYEWKNIMSLHGVSLNDGIKRDIENYSNAKEEDFYKWWGCDQQILTDRLKKYGYDKITFINRGTGSHGYARGRVDRAPGGWVFNQPELIDAHLMQQTHHSTEKINKLYDLLNYVWPNEDFLWFRTYTERFRQLTGHKG